MKKLTLLLLVSAGLSGCLTTEEVAARRAAAEAARAAPYELWLGHSELELIRAWGVPDQFYQTAGIRFMVYVAQTIVNTPAQPAFPPPPATPVIPATPPRVDIFTCTTTFEVLAERITNWQVEGDRCRPPPPPPS